jgi:hypothetical protein
VLGMTARAASQNLDRLVAAGINDARLILHRHLTESSSPSRPADDITLAPGLAAA